MASSSNAITTPQARGYMVRGGGVDYHSQGSGHCSDDRIATPVSVVHEQPKQAVSAFRTRDA